MPREHNHILRGDIQGCPACDYREGRAMPTTIERRLPNFGVYAAITEEQFNEGAVTHAGVKIVGSEDGEYVWAYGHIDPAHLAAAADELHRIEWGVDDHESFDPGTHVHHIWAVRVSPGLDEWRISWAAKYHDHGERFPLTLLEVDPL